MLTGVEVVEDCVLGSAGIIPDKSQESSLLHIEMKIFGDIFIESLFSSSSLNEQENVKRFRFVLEYLQQMANLKEFFDSSNN